ncbi:MAG TPA: hypothetical protein VH438_11275 [Gemmatimonadales bacterium]|jgi:hypothetical protein
MTENGGLDLLMETEIKLAERWAEAQRKAEATVAAAQRARQEAETRFQENLDRAAQELATALAAQCESEVGRLKAEAEAGTRRLEGLSQARLDALAQEVARRVLDTWRAERAA